MAVCFFIVKNMVAKIIENFELLFSFRLLLMLCHAAVSFFLGLLVTSV